MGFFLLIVFVIQVSCDAGTDSGGSGGEEANRPSSKTPAQFNYNDSVLHWENSNEIIFRNQDYSGKTAAVIKSDYEDYAQWVVDANVHNLLVRVPGPDCVTNNAGVVTLPGVESFEILAKALQNLQWRGILWFTPDTEMAPESWDCWAPGAAPLDSWKTYVDVLKNYNDTLISQGVPADYVFHGLLLEPEGSSFKSDLSVNPANYGWGTAPGTVGHYMRSKGFSRWTGDLWAPIPSSVGEYEMKLGYGIGADELKVGPPRISVLGLNVDLLVLEVYNLDYLVQSPAETPSTLIAANQPVAVGEDYATILSQYPTVSNSIYAAPETVSSINAGEIVFAFSYEQYIQNAALGVFGNQGWSAQDFANMLIEFKSKMQAVHGYSAVRTGVYHQPVKEIKPACDSSIENCYKGFRPRYAGDWGL